MPPTDSDDFEVALVRRRLVRIAALGVVVAAALGALIYVIARDRADRRAWAEADRAAAARRRPAPLDDAAEAQTLRDTLDRTAKSIAERDATFRRAVLAEAPAPGPTVCPITVVTAETSPTRPEARWVPAVPYLEVGPDDAPQSHLAIDAQPELTRARELIEHGQRPPSIESIGALTDHTRHELVFRPTSRKPPTRIGKLFEPGAVTGTAVLWDHETARIVCVGAVTAHSSENVLARVVADVPSDVITGNPYAAHNATSATIALDEDLLDQQFRAIADALRAVP